MEGEPHGVQKDYIYDKQKKDGPFIYRRGIFWWCYPEDWCRRKHYITHLEWVVSDVCNYFLACLYHTHLWAYSFIRSCPEQSSGLVIVIKIKVDDICIGEADVDLDELVDENEEGDSPLWIFEL